MDWEGRSEGVINMNGSDGNDQDNIVDEDEFQYTPLHKKEEEKVGKKEKVEKRDVVDVNVENTKDMKDCDKSDKSAVGKDQQDNEDEKIAAPSLLQQPPLPFKNDGSFLEMMKKMQSNSNDGN